MSAPLRLVRFKLGQRVHVRVDGPGHAIGIDGTVTRLRRGDHGAWIRLDKRCEHCPFPADDPTRSTHITAYPDDCDPARGSP